MGTNSFQQQSVAELIERRRRLRWDARYDREAAAELETVEAALAAEYKRLELLALQDPEMVESLERADERLKELRRVRASLWADREDPRVLSKLTAVQAKIRALDARRKNGLSNGPSIG